MVKTCRIRALVSFKCKFLYFDDMVCESCEVAFPIACLSSVLNRIMEYWVIPALIAFGHSDAALR